MRIGRPDHARVGTRDLFAPDIDIEDARQRWLFRMAHTRRPLQEKIALFCHNHFATASTTLTHNSGPRQETSALFWTDHFAAAGGKLATDAGPLQAVKMLAFKSGALRGPQGQ